MNWEYVTKYATLDLNQKNLVNTFAHGHTELHISDRKLEDNTANLAKLSAHVEKKSSGKRPDNFFCQATCQKSQYDLFVGTFVPYKGNWLF